MDAEHVAACAPNSRILTLTIHPKDRQPAFVDYETFWDTGYSLRSQKASMTDYIHDDRFSIHGAAVARGRNEPIWLRNKDLYMWIHQAREDGCLFVGHHTLFDGYITTRHCDAEFPDYFCTMGLIDLLYQGAMGRGLDEVMTSLLRWPTGKTDILSRTKGRYWDELAPSEREEMAFYAKDDLKATQETFYKFSPFMPEGEWRIMSLILQMFCHPRLEFDSDLLLRALSEAHLDRDSRIADALEYFGCTEKDLSGNITFAELIESCGIKMPMKQSPSDTEKMIPALAKTDQGFQNLLEHDDPRVKALAEGRLAVKSTQGITRAQRFVDLDKAVGYCPVAYNYYRAHTGRLSGANKINLANLKNGSDLRKSIVAPKGFVLGVADSSQIEARDNAYISGQEDLLDLFRAKRDPYNDMASEIFGRPIDRKKDEDYMEGFIGKTAVLGLGYQMGGPKFKWTCEIGAKTRLGIDYSMPLDEAYAAVEAYRRKNFMIARQWDLCQEWLYRMIEDGEPFDHDYGEGKLTIVPKENKVYFPNGTYLYYPCLDFDDGSFTYVVKLGSKYVNRYIYGGKFVENIVQKHSRDIVAWQMCNIAERYKVVLHTYDENVALIPESEADEGMEWVINEMKRLPAWASGLPIDAEGGYAKEYSK